MHHVTVIEQSILNGTTSHSASRFSTVKFILLFAWQAKLTCTKHNFDTHQSVTDVAGAGTPPNDSPARAELYGYATNNIIYCRPSSSAAFRTQFTGERGRHLCSEETSDSRQNCYIVWPSEFSPTCHVWAWNLLGIYTCMHMVSREYASSPASPICPTHAWDYVIILWRHNLGATFFVFHVRDKGNVQCSINVEDCVISKICNAVQLRLTW